MIKSIYFRNLSYKIIASSCERTKQDKKSLKDTVFLEMMKGFIESENLADIKRLMIDSRDKSIIGLRSKQSQALFEYALKCYCSDFNATRFLILGCFYADQRVRLVISNEGKEKLALSYLLKHHKKSLSVEPVICDLLCHKSLDDCASQKNDSFHEEMKWAIKNLIINKWGLVLVKSMPNRQALIVEVMKDILKEQLSFSLFSFMTSVISKSDCLRYQADLYNIVFHHIDDWVSSQDVSKPIIKNPETWQSIQVFLRHCDLKLFEDLVDDICLYEFDGEASLGQGLFQDRDDFDEMTHSEKIEHIASLMRDASVSSKIRVDVIKIRGMIRRREIALSQKIKGGYAAIQGQKRTFFKDIEK